MIKGTTKSGFKFEIDETKLNDYRFMKDLSKMEENPLRFPAVLEKILGDEQEEALMKHLEDEEGRVDTEKVAEELADILSNGKETKN